MVQLRTKRMVGDNSGVREIRCIKVKSGRVGKKGVYGKMVLGVVRKYRKGTKWKRGALVSGVLVSRKKEKSRVSGGWVRSAGVDGRSGVVLLNKKAEPLGNRRSKVVYGERRECGYGKVLARGPYLV